MRLGPMRAAECASDLRTLLVLAIAVYGGPYNFTGLISQRLTPYGPFAFTRRLQPALLKKMKTLDHVQMLTMLLPLVCSAYTRIFAKALSKSLVCYELRPDTGSKLDWAE